MLRSITTRRLWLVVLIVAGVCPVVAQSGEQTVSAPQQTRQPTETNANDPPAMFPHLADTRYWLSGQANFIFQTHPPFHAPYSGLNSLDPNYEKATSRVVTLYTGMRLNDSTEILIDIEEAGGAALTT